VNLTPVEGREREVEEERGRDKGEVKD